jgi:hypothetical protein
MPADADWDLVPGEHVQVVRRKEVASCDLRFEFDDIGLSPLRGDEEWVEACVGKAHQLCFQTPLQQLHK